MIIYFIDILKIMIKNYKIIKNKYKNKSKNRNKINKIIFLQENSISMELVAKNKIYSIFKISRK